MTPAVEFRSVSKAFHGTPVLREVSLSLAPGRVLGLVGENGAGKSTLMNVLGGVVTADSGEMRRAGSAYAPRRPADASAAGIALVHQELNLFPNLSVAENLFLTGLPRRVGLPWVDRRALRQQAAELLDAVGLQVDPAEAVEALSPGERQLVEIAKALRGRPKVVVFDEPTTSLTAPEAEHLFGLIGRLRRDGVAVVYVSHGLGDVLRLCDDVAVLRDGRAVAAAPVVEFTVPRLVSLMVGRDLDQVFPPRRSRPTSEPALEVRRVSRGVVVDDVSFSLRRGEVLGIAGLMGSGRTELARILFGLDRADRGEIAVAGRPIRRPSPRRCIRQGMAFLTEDRRAEGLLAESGVEENVALPSLSRFARKPFFRIDRRAMSRSAGEGIAAAGVRCRDPRRQPVRTLSGGNQQKVVFAKWLIRRPAVFLLDEPTRGVDVGAKFEIYRTIDDLAAGGAGVLLISSEIEELIGLCDRILVLSQGRLVASHERAEFDREAMLQAAFGEGRLR